MELHCQRPGIEQLRYLAVAAMMINVTAPKRPDCKHRKPQKFHKPEKKRWFSKDINTHSHTHCSFPVKITILQTLVTLHYNNGWDNAVFRQKTSAKRAEGSSIKWQEWRGSNPQPPVLETGALPIELHSCRLGINSIA